MALVSKGNYEDVNGLLALKELYETATGFKPFVSLISESIRYEEMGAFTKSVAITLRERLSRDDSSNREGRQQHSVIP